MKIKYIVIHHSAVSREKNSEQFNAINIGHKKRNWGTVADPIYTKKNKIGFYIQYHYFIEPKGLIKTGRLENEIGWHSGVWKINKKSIAICLAGNFDIEYPTREQETKLLELLRQLKEKYPEAEIKHHRDFKPTHCPGTLLNKNWYKNLISNNKDMEYVEQGGEQYIRYQEPFNIAFNIGDVEELQKLKKKGLPDVKPRTVTDMDKYEIYPLVSKERMAIIVKELRDLMGF